MHPLLPIHIAAGAAALLAGGGALALRKGGPRHAAVGTAFFGSMLVMAGTGSVIAVAMPERGTALIGVLTCYLVATSWLTARRRSGEARPLDWAAFGAALALGGGFVAIGLACLAEPDGRLDELPAAVHFVFATIACLAAALDLNFLLRRRLSGAQRLARHLWRMCAALLIAATSFFLGQQKHLPEIVQGTLILFVPPLAVLVTMLFWLVRLRFPHAFRTGGRAPSPLPAALAAEGAQGR